MSSTELVFVGDAFLDIACFTQAMEFATQNRSQIRLGLGGTAANMAIAAATHGPVGLIAPLAFDLAASFLRSLLEKGGVTILPCANTWARTGLVLSHESPSQVTYFVDVEGPRNRSRELHSDWAAQCAAPNAGHIHLTGHWILDCLVSNIDFDEIRASIPSAWSVSVDLGASARIREVDSLQLEAGLAILRPNLLITGRSEIEATGVSLLSRVPNYVVTNGPNPSVYSDGHMTRNSSAPRRLPHQMATLGAGDHFAGLLVAKLHGASTLGAAVESAIAETHDFLVSRAEAVAAGKRPSP
ncbi:MAG: PfkB family carbohydrate kinase [Nocardioides sp.]